MLGKPTTQCPETCAALQPEFGKLSSGGASLPSYRRAYRRFSGPRWLWPGNSSKESSCSHVSACHCSLIGPEYTALLSLGLSMCCCFSPKLFSLHSTGPAPYHPTGMCSVVTSPEKPYLIPCMVFLKKLVIPFPFAWSTLDSLFPDSQRIRVLSCSALSVVSHSGGAHTLEEVKE